jgi:transcriptional regulator with XRE-family HTH domain
MDANAPTVTAGSKVKQLRKRLGLTLREVEMLSRRFAREKQNQDFFISRGWLNNVENGSYTPGFFKLYALGAIYRTHWSSMFAFFGLHVSEFGRDQAMFAPPKTQLTTDLPEIDDTIAVPLRSSEGFRLDRTNLLSKLVEIWGEVPIRLLQHLDLRNGVYGLVGLSDKCMYPIIRPGSIVQIDQNQRKIANVKWDNEHERPIYFLELRGEYICSWCEMSGGYLSAVPHPNSKCEVRRFSYPREAEIVGRVVGVTMPLALTGHAADKI